jgi:hypothetical protein
MVGLKGMKFCLSGMSLISKLLSFKNNSTYNIKGFSEVGLYNTSVLPVRRTGGINDG